jgi:hypothetical protein
MVMVSWEAAVTVRESDMNNRNSSLMWAGRKVYAVSPPPTSAPATVKGIAYPWWWRPRMTVGRPLTSDWALHLSSTLCKLAARQAAASHTGHALHAEASLEARQI